MRFQFRISLTEEDYVAFNQFHALESAQGKKQANRARLLYVVAMAALSVFVVAMFGWERFSVIYVSLVVLFIALYLLFYQSLVKRNIKANVKRLKQSGKLPFDAESLVEFHEDRFVEITAVKRMEQSYHAIERVCVVRDEYLFLYTSSVQAVLLPISQLRQQGDEGAFERFLTQKCNTVEYY